MNGIPRKGAKRAAGVALLPVLVLLTAAAKAEVPGAPTALAVYSTTSGELEARWSSSDFASTSSYKVQWKSGSQEYDSVRQDSIDPATSQVVWQSNTSSQRYKHVITGLTDGDGYTVRVEEPVAGWRVRSRRAP